MKILYNKVFNIFVIMFVCVFSVLNVFINDVQAQSGWVQQVSNTDKLLKSVYFVNPNTGYAVGHTGRVLKTIDGGATWTVSTLIDNSEISNLFCVHFFNENTGIVGSRKIFRTTNGGSTWGAVYTLNPEDTVHAVFFYNNEVGYAAVNFGRILKTINGGSTWTEQGLEDDHYAVYFPSLDTGYVVGDDQTYHTYNGGVVWTLSLVKFFNDLQSITCFDSKTCVTCGKGGYIYKSTNAGVNWNQVNLGTTDDFYSVTKRPDSVLFIGGQGGTILKSTSKGDNWTTQTSNTNQTLYSIYFVNNFTGYAVGNNGTVIKTTTGGTVFINQISTEVPDKFYLHQNYPNPFNPVTKIRFDVPSNMRNSNVRLSVFDLSGKMVAELINQRLSSGTYEYEFDANGLASGIYYYELSNGDFKEVKKMVLVK
ncbi:MAG TPA: YCF48-related protein [Ignavibacteria bacterium]|nr:YCF48-related protein [Ignavibacteria bacterium]